MNSLFGNSLFTKVALAMVFGAIATPELDALAIRVYDPDRHDRFLNFPSTPSHNPNFMYASLDFTGVGWDAGDTRHQFCMVSPIHFVGSHHVLLNLGAPIRFLTSSGALTTRLNVSLTAITNDAGANSDLNIGKVNTPFSPNDGVSFHPYLNLPNENLYRNKTVIILGKDARGGQQLIDRVTSTQSSQTNSTRVIKMLYSLSSGDDDDAHLENGDSGSPVFFNQNGVAAIVATNSLVSPSGNVNYANFIPHYIDKLNAIMALDGYHMTKAIPGSTTMTLNHQLPGSPVRAGHAFTINLTLNNTGLTIGENVKLTNSFPAGTTVTSATGTGWFDESSPTLTQARKASLTNGTSSNYSLTLTIPSAGTAQHQVTYACDQFSVDTENFNITVLDSFISWASTLADQSSGGDDDNDGISNLLEYAFGGDPLISSQLHPNTLYSLLPNYSDGSISYIRRTDAGARALTYQIKSSTTLEGGSWSDADALFSQPTFTPIGSDFELVTLDLSTADTERFFRVEVTLAE